VQESKTHYLGKSRQVLEINDQKKLHELLTEQRSELMRLSVGFGRKRMSHTGAGKAPVKNKKAIQTTRRHIARILTRLSQLKQESARANN
jgi:ribosomal protein L29